MLTFPAGKAASPLTQTSRMLPIPPGSCDLPLTLRLLPLSSLPEAAEPGHTSAPTGTLQHKINEQKGLNQRPHRSQPPQEATGLTGEANR